MLTPITDCREKLDFQFDLLRTKEILIFYDRPLLIALEDANRKIYYQLLLDEDPDSDRWMIFTVPDEDNQRYLDHKQSLRETLFHTTEPVIILDFDNTGTPLYPAHVKEVTDFSEDDLPQD